MIVHDSYNFEAITLHGLPTRGSELVKNLRRNTFGLNGSTTIHGGRGGEPMTIEAIFAGYASPAAVEAAYERIKAQQGQLTGTLRVSQGTNLITYANTTFERAVMPNAPAYSDATVRYWAKLVLFFFKRNGES